MLLLVFLVCVRTEPRIGLVRGKEIVRERREKKESNRIKRERERESNRRRRGKEQERTEERARRESRKCEFLVLERRLSLSSSRPLFISSFLLSFLILPVVKCPVSREQELREKNLQETRKKRARTQGKESSRRNKNCTKFERATRFERTTKFERTTRFERTKRQERRREYKDCPTLYHEPLNCSHLLPCELFFPSTALNSSFPNESSDRIIKDS